MFKEDESCRAGYLREQFRHCDEDEVRAATCFQGTRKTCLYALLSVNELGIHLCYTPSDGYLGVFPHQKVAVSFKRIGNLLNFLLRFQLLKTISNFVWIMYSSQEEKLLKLNITSAS